MKRLAILTVVLLTLTACSSFKPEPTIVTQTEYVEKQIPIQERPKGVDFPNVEWYIITAENIDQKAKEIEEKTGEVVIFAITPKGYENLAIGIAELRRYVKEQQAIIGYYEEAVSLDDTAEPASEK